MAYVLRVCEQADNVIGDLRLADLAPGRRQTPKRASNDRTDMAGDSRVRFGGIDRDAASTVSPEPVRLSSSDLRALVISCS